MFWWIHCCSLTASEGISLRCTLFISLFMFPHCKWGYIVKLPESPWPPPVPSLQVRVYRFWLIFSGFRLSSLTASESISLQLHHGRDIGPFPHCKWGYIDEVLELHGCHLVPSLHVRVYRYNRRYRILNICNIYSPAITLPGLFFFVLFLTFYMSFFIAQFIFFPIRHFKSEKKSAKK